MTVIGVQHPAPKRRLILMPVVLIIFVVVAVVVIGGLVYLKYFSKRKGG